MNEPGFAPTLGLVEWFRPDEYERVQAVLRRLQALGIRELRTAISWADWHTAEGQEWYAWLLPKLAETVDLLPCFLYTPPSLGVAARASAPPRNPQDYADFLDQIITEFGDCFDLVELWNEPNNLSEYDWTLDPGWNIFAEMIGKAAYWAQRRGKLTVLGGMAPADPNWLSIIGSRGVLDYIDVVGIHGFPGVWQFAWEGWPHYVNQTRQVLQQHGCEAEIWITETGFSTWRHDHEGQLRSFLEALDAPVNRVYWYGLQDLNPEHPTVDGFHSDERDYYFGLMQANGREKLLYRVLRDEGVEGAYELGRLTASPGPRRPDRPHALITGGAGFVGSNLAHRLLSEGRSVAIYDNLSRPGVEQNFRWLREQYGDRVRLHLADMRDPIALRRAVQNVEIVFHLAAQVAVTTSLDNPLDDFEINARGTMNLLEELRRLDEPVPVIFTSTNKVYGALDDLQLQIVDRRYEPLDLRLRSYGVGEDRALDFHSPYGCSKGCADQYLLDHARTYGLPAVVFRMSCIYGPHQRGTEDQGWLAHFLLQALAEAPITIYGDGYQVRDVLFIDNLIEAFILAESRLGRVSGQAFNLGGGPDNTLSLLELIDNLEDLLDCRVRRHYGDWRQGDQRYYVSDTRKFSQATGWGPKTGVEEGLQRLYAWLTGRQASVRAIVGL